MLPLAFLKNRGFGEDAASNFTKSFSVLSFFFKGPCTPPLPCVRGMRRGSLPPMHVGREQTKHRTPLQGHPRPLIGPLVTVCQQLTSGADVAETPASLRWLRVHSQGSPVFSATRTHFHSSINLCPCWRVSGFQRLCAKL